MTLADGYVRPCFNNVYKTPPDEFRRRFVRIHQRQVHGGKHSSVDRSPNTEFVGTTSLPKPVSKRSTNRTAVPLGRRLRSTAHTVT